MLVLEFRFRFDNGGTEKQWSLVLNGGAQVRFTLEVKLNFRLNLGTGRAGGIALS